MKDRPDFTEYIQIGFGREKRILGRSNSAFKGTQVASREYEAQHVVQGMEWEEKGYEENNSWQSRQVAQ